VSFVKRNPQAPTGFFPCEAAGLRWLSAAADGVPCAQVVAVDDDALTLERLAVGAPDPVAAEEFGARLVHTHDAGASGPHRTVGPARDSSGRCTNRCR
jgi:fructosamine-3-kinase